MNDFLRLDDEEWPSEKEEIRRDMEEHPEQYTTQELLEEFFDPKEM